MTERGREALTQGDASLSIGASGLTWEDGVLTWRFNETASPWPLAVRGVVRLRPRFVNRRAFALDAAGRHVWRPIAPRAEVEVTLDSPAATWRGEGYFDTNSGAEPLEDAFAEWDWSRSHRPSDTMLFYDVARVGGEASGLALRFSEDGALSDIEPPPRVKAPDTGWRIARRLRGGGAEAIRTLATLEDTPFYARSMARGLHEGEPASIMHETLRLDRLRSPAVKAMLPFRMPRVFW